MVRHSISTAICVGLAIAAVAAGAPPVPSDDEPDLQIGRVKSMQVAATLIGHAEFGLTLESLQGPFKSLLHERGVKLDQNNYDNVVSTNCEIARTRTGATVYAVRIASEYREPCTINRLNLSTTCAVWETLDLIRTFDNPADVQTYVAKTVAQQAADFGVHLARK